MLQLYFATLDEVIFECLVSQWAEVKWSPWITEPARTSRSSSKGRFTIELQCPKTILGVYSGEAAVTMISRLLSQMCLVFVFVFRCTCEPCWTSRLNLIFWTKDWVPFDPKLRKILQNGGLRHDSRSWRLCGLAASVASRSLGMDLVLI